MNELEILAEAQKRLEKRRGEVVIVAKPDDSIGAHCDAVLKRIQEPNKEIAARVQKRASEAELAAAKALFNAAGCPARHAQKTELNRSGDWGTWEGRIAGELGGGFLYALVGKRGNGKTQLAVELVRKNSAAGRKSQFITAMGLFMEFKAGYDGGKAEKQVMADFASVSLLVIDEIGKRRENEWENGLLCELINRRYNALKDTLLLTNQDASDLESALGPSIVSRMRETGGVIECTWESYR